MVYQRAASVAALPWHREEPAALLKRAIERRGGGGRALDLGCGEGVSAVYLAERGFTVVAVDFVPAALELARERARAAGVTLELREADVLSFSSRTGFDVVVDSGCLHHLPGSALPRYREMLDCCLVPGGDFVLVHFGKRHALDWRPLGPRRLSKGAITRLFAPLHLEEYDETMYRLPLPVGPTALAGVYWFRHGVRSVAGC